MALNSAMERGEGENMPREGGCNRVSQYVRWGPHESEPLLTVRRTIKRRKWRQVPLNY